MIHALGLLNRGAIETGMITRPNGTRKTDRNVGLEEKKVKKTPKGLSTINNNNLTRARSHTVKTKI
jgi:hypothetical protein